MVVWYHVALAALWGGLMALERRAFLQAMFSRPLVAATTTGLLLEDVASGLFVGMLLELFHLGSASLGAALPDNDTLAATGTSAAAAGLAHASGGGGTPALWSIAILLFLPLGRLGRIADRWLEQHSTHLAEQALSSAEQGNLRRAVRQNLWGMWPHFAVYGTLTASCAIVGYLLGAHVNGLPLSALRGLAWAYPAMASVAAAIAVKGSRAKHAPIYAVVSAAAVTVASIFVLLTRTA